jgi:hypothetical protein
MKNLTQRCKNLSQTCSDLLQHCKTMSQPCGKVLQHCKTLSQPCGSVIARNERRSLSNLFKPIEGKYFGNNRKPELR